MGGGTPLQMGRMMPQVGKRLEKSVENATAWVTICQHQGHDTQTRNLWAGLINY